MEYETVGIKKSSGLIPFCQECHLCSVTIGEKLTKSTKRICIITSIFFLVL